jgi:L-asparaginase
LFYEENLPSKPDGVCSFYQDRVPVPVKHGTGQSADLINFIPKTSTMAIRIFITGGTFDKEYNELNGELYFKDTHMQDLLEMGRCRLDTEIRTLMMIDSLEMTPEDRELIAYQCQQCDETQIVITHGTDTMSETARVLARKVKDKTIVLFGAMIPIKFGSSDGLFNLGSALAFVQTLPPGVYVAMNGRYFNWDNVRKNKQTGRFEELKQV